MESESELSSKLESDDAVEERRQRLLARLDARRIRQATETKPAATTTESNFDELETKAANLINSPEAGIEPEFLQELETALALMPPGRQSRRLREALNALRNRMQEQAGLMQQNTPFSFSTKKDATERQKSKVTTADYSPLGPSQSVAKSRMNKSITITSKHDEEMIVDGEDGREVVIHDIARCVIRVPFKASAVHIKSVNDTTLIFAPVKTSLLIRDCQNVTIAVAAQQIRIHDSHQMRLYVEVRGALIIEDCDGIEVAPYNVTGFQRDPQNDNWRHVRDFNWFSTEEQQSPNWKIMTNDSTKCFHL